MRAVLAGTPLGNCESHPAFTTATLAAGMYVTKLPSAVDAQNAAEIFGHDEAVSSASFDPPPYTTSPKPAVGIEPPTILPVVEGGSGAAGAEAAAMPRKN